MLSRIHNIKFSRKLILGVIIIILLLGLIAIISSRSARTDGESLPVYQQPPTPVIVEKVNNLDVERKVIRMYCLEEGKVDYAIIELFPKGGVLPYKFVVENSQSQTEGPFTISNKRKPIVITLHGGEIVSVRIWSADSQELGWEGTISIPAKDAYCYNVQQLTHTLTITSGASHTPSKTPTSTFTLTPTTTFTPTLTPTKTATSIYTLTPTPTYTLTPTFTPTLTPTNMSTPVFTLTPTPTPTFTLTPTFTPTPTFTLLPTITLPPTPTSTETPLPTPITYTPTNTLTHTPTPSSERECSDGIDNDGDGDIDYPDDEQCKSSQDNNEAR